jgi:CheY-like chemotaxis protein
VCNILVVEDHLDVRQAMVELIEDAGHTPHEASNGREALDWLEGQDKPPCIVLLDLRMPVMDGWDFLRDLQSDVRWKDLSVIVISTTVHRGSPNPVLRAKAFWSKPPDAEQVQAIHQYCPEHRESWPPVAANS